MGAGGVCGLCHVGGQCKCPVCTPSGDNKVRLHAHVSSDDNEATPGTWVECRVANCRAQYVIYNPAALKVTPKCFYCRHGGRMGTRPAPTVECRKCFSRMVYPEEYRPTSFNAKTWECVACVSGLETVIDRETTPRELVAENGRDWLLVVKEDAIASPLNNRSLFHTASNAKLAVLAANVTVLPEITTTLTLSGKPLLNAEALRASLCGWVLARRAQSGECTLCFSPTRKDSLRPACGRTGCGQLVCEPCRRAWYGLNEPGRLLNPAALGCPFCRRMPAPGAVARFGITRIGGARTAVEESGDWMHAWCRTCGFAKRYAERICARGVPANIRDWECETCVEQARAAGAVELEGRGPKTCPRCGVMTEKTMGCDHISCPCGTHWCYACGEESSEREIYVHFSERHGGLWGTEWDEDDEDM